MLKIYSDIKYQKLSVENGRIACDSQFECNFLACVEEKVDAAFAGATTWLETAIVIYDMPVMIIVYQLSCAYSEI